MSESTRTLGEPLGSPIHDLTAMREQHSGESGAVEIRGAAQRREQSCGRPELRETRAAREEHSADQSGDARDQKRSSGARAEVRDASSTIENGHRDTSSTAARPELRKTRAELSEVQHGHGWFRYGRATWRT